MRHGAYAPSRILNEHGTRARPSFRSRIRLLRPARRADPPEDPEHDLRSGAERLRYRRARRVEPDQCFASPEPDVFARRPEAASRWGDRLLLGWRPARCGA